MEPKNNDITRYRISAAYSPEDECYVARVAGVPSCAAHGDSPEEAVKEARIALRGILAAYKKQGRALPEPDPMLAELRALRHILNLSKLATEAGIPRTTLNSRLQNGTPFTEEETSRIHQVLEGCCA